jgi:uncharacterized protein
MQRQVIWTGLDDWRAEVATIELDPDGLRAKGTQLGADPIPYRLDYMLDAPDDFVTASLRLHVSGEGWGRSLALTRDGAGEWSAERAEEGSVDLPPPRAELERLGEALDCDLAFSPLTNLMPIRRHRLHEGPGEAEFTMAWVEVPELTVHASRQGYEHVRRDRDGAVVRFLDRGLFPGFTAELELDPDGVVRVYPELARRIG